MAEKIDTARVMAEKDIWNAFFRDEEHGSREHMSFEVPLAAYAVLCAKRVGGETSWEDVLASMPDEAVRARINELFGPNMQESIRRMATYSEEDGLVRVVTDYDVFSEFYRRDRRAAATPQCLRDLALAILDVRDGDRVADLGCTCGDFLVQASRAGHDVELFGNDIADDYACVARLRLGFQGISGTVETADLLSATPKRAFDKVFTNFPLGMRLGSLSGEGGVYDLVRNGEAGLDKNVSADWAFVRAACDSLAEGGIAVAIVSTGATSNGGDLRARASLVESGMLRAVIALPDRLFPRSIITATMLVLGRNDGPVRMVDATDLHDRGRRQGTMSAAQISEVVEMLGADGELSALVDVRKIAGTRYDLSPRSYLHLDFGVENPVRLGDLILDVRRGTTLKAAELDELASDRPTGISFLRLSDISDGYMEPGTQSIRELDPKLGKARLTSGDLLISKNGAPFKIAVAEVPEGRTIVANGNLYIISLDTKRVDPYYVAAYLASRQGKAALGRQTVGTSIPNLPLRNLREIMIPLPGMMAQQRVANRYKEAIRRVRGTKHNLEVARRSVERAYERETGL